MPVSEESFLARRSVKIGGILALTAGLFCGFGALLNSALLTQFGTVVLISIVIWQACDPFAETAQWIGRRLNLPGSVRGATLDAVASSIPELFSGIFFVLHYDDFGATVATCAGSAVYNMILIPAICAIGISIIRKDRPYIEVESEVLYRDGVWFLVSELLLLYCLFSGNLSWMTAIIFLLLYAGYVLHLYRDAATHRSTTRMNQGDPERNSDDTPVAGEVVSFFGGAFSMVLTMPRAIIVLIMTTLAAAAASFFLVHACESMSGELGVPTFFVAVIIASAASSVPDTMLSLGAALRGDDSGAVSNAFGSNTFDVNICLALPVLLFAILHDGQNISWSESESSGVFWLGVLLWVLSVITIGLLRHRFRIGRGKALVLCMLYLVFIGYAVAGSLVAK